MENSIEETLANMSDEQIVDLSARAAMILKSSGWSSLSDYISCLVFERAGHDYRVWSKVSGRSNAVLDHADIVQKMGLVQARTEIRLCDEASRVVFTHEAKASVLWRHASAAAEEAIPLVLEIMHREKTKAAKADAVRGN